jgi:replicative DNA helicase
VAVYTSGSEGKKGAVEPSAAAAGRVLPHSREAEEGVLGGILIDNRALSLVIEQLQGPEDFYVEAHQKIYSSMLRLSDASQPIDMITLAEALREGGQLEPVGGHSYLAGLIDATPSTANILHHARIVHDKAAVRRAIYAAKEIVGRGMGDHGDVEDFLDEAEKKVFEVARSRHTTPYVHVGPLVHDVFGEIEAAAAHDNSVTGISTGFTDLDKITAGLQPGDLIIIAGRPSMGKTAFALNLGVAAAQSDFRGRKAHVLVLSLEMGKSQLVRRMMCSEGRVDASRVRIGQIAHDDWPRLIEAANILSQMPVYIDDTAALTVMEVRAKARRLMSEHGLDLIIVDYLQLMRSSSRGAESREREISEISRSLKGLAKELSVPVIALSQLNRALEARQDKRPMLADLRESGAIEQDADVIMFVYRDEVYNKDTPDVGIAEVIIGKQRNGPIGIVRLRFTHQFTRFDNLARHDDRD